MNHGEWLYGRNAVYEALRAGRRSFFRIYRSQQARDTEELRAVEALAHTLKIPVERVASRLLDRMVPPRSNHQGLVAEVSRYPYQQLDDALMLAERRQEPPLLLLLDHLQDPQNVGTLLRTAEIVGVHGVMIPRRRSVGITPGVVNASSGATEYLTIIQVGNLAHTIRTLQQHGIFVVGVEDDTRASVFDTVPLTGPLALVMGAEGPGLARLTRERCDQLVRLPMRGKLASLNVAVAGSIVLYYVWRSRDANILKPSNV